MFLLWFSNFVVVVVVVVAFAVVGVFIVVVVVVLFIVVIAFVVVSIDGVVLPAGSSFLRIVLNAWILVLCWRSFPFRRLTLLLWRHFCFMTVSKLVKVG